MEKRLARDENVIWRKIGDEIAVIEDNGLSVHVLNKTAAHIWEMFDDHAPEEIATSLCERFDVTFEEASKDVQEILNKLENIGLLKPIEEATDR